MRTSVAVLALALVLPLAVPAAAGEAGDAREVDTHHRDFGDPGGFRNLLPPGQDGVVSGAEQLRGQTTGQYPAHVDDQLAPYRDLPGAVPGLTDADLDRYFKDASFGLPSDDVARVYSPTDGVVVVRDASFGVPHIFGETRDATMFAQGYTAAEDRLFLMDILRHLGRARLSEFLGASERNQQLDRDQLAVAPYREEDLTAQTEPKDVFGPEARRIRADGDAYVDGVNAYIAEARLDPSKRPAEYEALQQVPEDWKLEDIVATASLVGGIFGGGGGGELRNHCGLETLAEDVGAAEARRIFDDLAFATDAESPTTTDRAFPYLHDLGPVDPAAVADVDCASLRPIDGGTPSVDDVLDAITGALPVGQPHVAEGPFGPIPLALPGAASNAVLVSGDRTATGSPLAVFGPQTGYFVPQLLVEKDVHGPGISARGVAFAGTDVYVSIGRGTDYAWSATSSKADAVDTFVVELCEPDGSTPTVDSMGHVHRGECVPIDGWNHVQVAKPTAAAPSEEVVLNWRVERSPVYGPLVARGTTTDATPVAVATRRVTYGAETTSALGFMRVNDPDFMSRGFDAFREAMGRGVFYSFNWFYVDGNHVGYQHACGCPRRAPGVDPALPTWGTGEWDWEVDLAAGDVGGLIGFEEQPWELDPADGLLISWNNRQAPGFRASDREFSFGPVHRSDLLDTRLHGVVAAGQVGLPTVVEAVVLAATTDLRGQETVPLVARVLGERPEDLDARVAEMWERLEEWSREGGHRRDADGDGRYDHAVAVAVMDAWWPRLVGSVFDGAAADAVHALRVPVHDPPQLHLGSAFHTGMYAHVDKDLRQVLGEVVADPFSRTYCGDGDRDACRDALWESLGHAAQDLEDEFGSAAVDDWRRTVADDAIVHVPAGITTVPDIPWQNRPTFHQVVQPPLGPAAGAAAEPSGGAPGGAGPRPPLPATGTTPLAAAGLLALLVLGARWRRRRM